MFDPKRPTIACESGIWSETTSHTRIHPEPNNGPRESLRARLSRTPFAKWIRLLCLLRFLGSDKQHLILMGLYRNLGERFRLLPLGKKRFVVVSDREVRRDFAEVDKLSE